LDAIAVPGTVVTLPPGEVNKTLPQVAAIWDAALALGIDRDAVVVSFGGGVVGDLAGFAASTLLRGIRFVQLPTTLLAMVDASVGGKTGFDHAVGKNLVGSFHQPAHVVADLAHLGTLPKRELRAGLAEVVKIALTCDAALFETLERSGKSLLEDGSPELLHVVRRAIELKAWVVRQDEREQGLREILNFGHTIGHAIESGVQYKHVLHGEAIALGMVGELTLGARLGFSPAGLAARTAGVLESLGLRTEATPQELARAKPFLASDKKRRGAQVRLPLPAGVGTCRVHAVPLAALTGGT
jgi:3-dehydroquinate synthase